MNEDTQIPQNTPVEEVEQKVETTPVEQAPRESVDVDSIKSELEGSISDKVSKNVIEKIGEALGLNKKEEDALPKDPKELRKFIEETSQRKAKELFEARDREKDDAEQHRQQQLNQGAETFRGVWTRDYNEMANLGMVPKINNAQDANDLGSKTKVRLLSKMKEILDENAQRGVDHVPTLWEIAQRFPEVVRLETTAGANSPISGGGRTSGGGVAGDYSRMHSTSIEEMLAEKQSY